MNKKGIMGIGALVIFIASILVAAIGAFVILTTQEHLQSEALHTGSEVREAVGTNVILDSIRGKNVSNGVMSDMVIALRLGPSSNSIKLDKTSMLIITNNFSMNFNYGGIGEGIAYANREGREINNNITSIQTRLKTDLDGDDVEDYISVKDSTTLRFNLSTDGNIDLTIPDISLAGTVVSFNSEISQINDYGNISIVGTTTAADELDKNMNVKIYPKVTDRGAYSVEYVMRGKNSRDGVLSYGDILKVYIELSSSIGEEKPLSINIVTPIGISLTKVIATPNVMVDDTIALFP